MLASSRILCFSFLSLYSAFWSSVFQLTLNGPTVVCLLSLVKVPQANSAWSLLGLELCSGARPSWTTVLHFQHRLMLPQCLDSDTLWEVGVYVFVCVPTNVGWGSIVDSRCMFFNAHREWTKINKKSHTDVKLKLYTRLEYVLTKKDERRCERKSCRPL